MIASWPKQPLSQDDGFGEFCNFDGFTLVNFGGLWACVGRFTRRVRGFSQRMIKTTNRGAPVMVAGNRPRSFSSAFIAWVD